MRSHGVGPRIAERLEAGAFLADQVDDADEPSPQSRPDARSDGWADDRPYSSLMLAARMTLPHFSVCSSMNVELPSRDRELVGAEAGEVRDDI
jgi:hypothetical protein